MGEEGNNKKTQSSSSSSSSSSFFNLLKPYVTMVAMQFGYAGLYIITMISFKHGISHFVLVVYRHAVAASIIFPFAILFERKTRPKMTLSVFLKILALGFLEPVMDQDLYFMGMQKTSATFASAIINVLPAITFIMAVALRLERLEMGRVASQAKVMGTAMAVAGAAVMSVYKGAEIDIFGGGREEMGGGGGGSSLDQHWLSGTLMLLGGACGWSGFFILQSFVVKEYPAKLTLTAMICVMGMMESGAVAVVMERRPSAWALAWDFRLLAVVYSGVICSGIAYYVQGMISKERGPVFVTAFSPLGMIITAVMGVLILSEKLHVGSVLGAIIVVFGLYAVIWGKGKDLASSDRLMDTTKHNDGHELPIVDGEKTKTGHISSNGKVEITTTKSVGQVDAMSCCVTLEESERKTHFVML